MKIKIRKSEDIEIDLPRFFKIKNHPSHYYMTIGNKSAIEVTDYEFNESLVLLPKIAGVCLGYLPWLSNGIEQISEVEYKNAFIRVSLRMEKMMN